MARDAAHQSPGLEQKIVVVPKGTTLAGCAVLEEHDALNKLVTRCLAAAKKRAEELARGEK